MPEEGKEGTPADLELSAPAVQEVSKAAVEVERPSGTDSALTEKRLAELLDAQKAALEEAIDRKVQSVKDRRFGQIESKLEELLTLRQQVESAGGWDPVIAQKQQEDRLEKLIEARISKAAGPAAREFAQDSWQKEWAAESQKILDAAKEQGVTLTGDEYAQAMFNNGLAFATKGDAYAALNRVIVSKAKGESTPISVVLPEGGATMRVPEPKTPKNFQQKFAEAKGKSDDKAMRKLLDEQWAEVDKMAKVERVRKTLAESGVSPEDLT